jgi:hypothetical protein
MGAFGLLLLGLRPAELGRLVVKMDPELDPVDLDDASPIFRGW